MIITLTNKQYQLTHREEVRHLLHSESESAARIINQMIAQPYGLSALIGENVVELSLFFTAIPTEFRVPIITALIDHKLFFNHYVTSVFNLDTVLSLFSHDVCHLIISHILNHADIFKQLFGNSHHFNFIMRNFKEQYAQCIADHIISHPQLIKQICTNSILLIHTLGAAPLKYAQQFLSCILSQPEMVQFYFSERYNCHFALDTLPPTLALQLAQHDAIKRHIWHNYQIITRLLDIGLDPNIVDQRGNNALAHLLNSDLLPETKLNFGSRMIFKGVNPNTQDSNGKTFLHHLCEQLSPNMTGFIPTLISYGADPNITVNNRNALDALMLNTGFTSQHHQIALLLLQHGAKANVATQYPKNIFKMLYKHYPSVHQAFLAQGLPAAQEQQAQVIYATFSPAALAIAMHFHSPAHEARTSFFNLLLMLARDTSTADNPSFFKFLPNDTLCEIAKHLGIDDRSACMALITAVNHEKVHINQLYQKSASRGINVVQTQLPDGKYAFRFGKDNIYTLTVDYEHLKKELALSQSKPMQLFNWLLNKINLRYTPQAEKQALQNFRSQFAVRGFENHCTFFNIGKQAGSRQALYNQIKSSGLLDDADVTQQLKLK